MNDKVYINMNKHNNNLSKYACNDSDAIYLKPYNKDIRTTYFRDIDKILYSLSYIRYMDKTQVFTDKENDHIQKRMLHVQFVSKIARTIGRALNLNEDLIEAASLGHDIGHIPYGHVGERILNRISKELGEGNFMHNVNSVRNLLFIENYGNGLNISLQVYDAILCHNGEMLSSKLTPVKKNSEQFLKEYSNCYIDDNCSSKLKPMTLEGCVVRISDVIAYIGRDLEDGIRLGLIKWEDVPKSIRDVLGDNNSDIVNTITCDIIKESFNKPYIKLSDKVYKAIFELKNFNYKNIYSKAYSNKELELIEHKFRFLTEHYLDDLKNHNYESSIYKSYLNNMSDEYKQNTNERIVIDYRAGMTDTYFNEKYQLWNDYKLF